MEGDDRDKWIVMDISIRRPLKTRAESMVEGIWLFKLEIADKALRTEKRLIRGLSASRIQEHHESCLES